MVIDYLFYYADITLRRHFIDDADAFITLSPLAAIIDVIDVMPRAITRCLLMPLLRHAMLHANII